MNHRRLLRLALWMWAAPLVAGSAVFLGFLFLRSPLFVMSGLALLVVGGLCLSAGMVAVIAILGTHNTFLESPRRFYKKKALALLGLLLLNLALALLYVVIGGALLEPAALEAEVSPSGRWLAEVVYLDEGGKPPYGQAVTLRPKPGLFWHEPRTVVFGSYCRHPLPKWESDQTLWIMCNDTHGAGTRLTRYREVTVRYRQTGNGERPRRRPK